MRRTLTADPTTGRPTPEALESERDWLTQEHARLTVDDPEGSALAVVKQRHAAITDALKDRAIAAAETQHRAVVAEAKARAQRETEMRARLEVLETVERPAAMGEVDADAARLAQSLARAQTLNALIDRLRAQLGLTSRSRTEALAFRGGVTWALRAFFGTVAHAAELHRFRHPLAALFAPPAVPPPASEGGPDA